MKNIVAFVSILVIASFDWNDSFKVFAFPNNASFEESSLYLLMRLPSSHHVRQSNLPNNRANPILVRLFPVHVNALYQNTSHESKQDKSFVPHLESITKSPVELEESYPEWSVNDWWQQNIDEDLKEQNRLEFDSVLPKEYLSKIGKFVQISPTVGTDLETSESVASKRFQKSRNISEENDKLDEDEIFSDNQKTSAKLSKKSYSAESNIKRTKRLFVPKSSLTSIKSLFYDYFTSIRNGMQDQTGLLTLKRNLRKRFLDYGLQTAIQGFWPNIPKRNDKGHNIVGIYPGIYRNDSLNADQDSVLIIGAHFDTVMRSPGVEDNGSGSVAVMEVARLLKEHRCRLNTTVIFVLFDMEEDGLIGSKNFVRHYLYPMEIEKNQTPVKGAIILDMLLEYDTTVNSQMVQGIGNLLPEWNERVRQNRYRADFAAVWARRNVDSPLFHTLQSNWLNRQKYKLFLMDVPLPKLGRQLTSGFASKKLKPYQTFLRSDHSSFWYPHSMKNQTINAILLTDLGPWRKKVATKYHSVADNVKLLNRHNLLFLKNAIDSLVKTIVDISDGKCSEM